MRTCCIPLCTEKDSKSSKYSFHRLPNDPEIRAKWLQKINRPNFQPPTFTYVCSKHFFEDDYEFQFGKRGLRKGVVPSLFLHVEPEKQQEPLRRRPIILQRSVSKNTSNNEDRTECTLRKDKYANDQNVISFTIEEKNTNTAIDGKWLTIPEERIIILENESLQEVNYSDNTKVISPYKNKDASDHANVTESLKRFRYEGDFNEEDMLIPDKAIRYLRLARKKFTILSKKLKNYQQTTRRLRKKFTHVRLLLDKLNKNDLIPREAELLIKDILPDVPSSEMDQ